MFGGREKARRMSPGIQRGGPGGWGWGGFPEYRTPGSTRHNYAGEFLMEESSQRDLTSPGLCLLFLPSVCFQLFPTSKGLKDCGLLQETVRGRVFMADPKA